MTSEEQKMFENWWERAGQHTPAQWNVFNTWQVPLIKEHARTVWEAAMEAMKTHER